MKKEKHLFAQYLKLLKNPVHDESSATTFAKALINIAEQVSCTDLLKKINRNIEQLNIKYPENIAIAVDYAKCLTALAVVSDKRNLAHEYWVTINKLKALCEKYPDVENYVPKISHPL